MDKKVSIERIADALENIEDLTNELPEVNTEDAGKVLTVSPEGEWEAAAPSGGGLTLYGPYIATVPDDYTVNKGSTISASLEIFFNSNNVPVEAPSTNHIELYAGIYSPVCIMNFMPGSITKSPSDEDVYSPPMVTLCYPDVGEDGPASINLNAEKLFAMIYSDVEFTPIES